MAHPLPRKTTPPLSGRATFLDPFDNVHLLGYFHDIAKWHGFIRFLGLPHLKENSDQPIQALYVEPLIARRPIHLDEAPEKWLREVESALEAVAQNQYLVLLGDPGSGKSTLVSWIAWQLSRPEKNAWQERLGPIVPIPMVLRELELSASLTWRDLWAAFLAHPVAERLRYYPNHEELFEQGQVLFLLDGLDEIGSLDLRRALKGAVQEGARHFPQCRFLLTSRIVGYEQVPFTGDLLSFQIAERKSEEVAEWEKLRYVAPLVDTQIEQFASNWYTLREAAEAKAKTGAEDLVKAVRGSEATLRLARNPNLLTLMALVHRVQRQLPHGRALLFEKISEAYLESIDLFRGIKEVDFSLNEKKSLLGYVGFQMQLRRSRAAAKGERDARREVLVDQETVCGWILKAMEASARGTDPKSAQDLVDYIGRRSGLLLPRGEGLFAFTHLSFQEYFAALYLAEQVTSPRWLSGKPPRGARSEDLVRYANQWIWRECLILLFELLADRRDWVEEISDRIFGRSFDKLNEGRVDSQRIRAALLAEISVDPYSGLSRKKKYAAWKACWKWQLSRQGSGNQLELFSPITAAALFAAQREDLAEIWRILCETVHNLGSKFLSLNRAPISDVSPLAGLKSLQSLELNGTLVADVSPLSGLSNLENLNLVGTPVSDILPLSGLSKLRGLSLGGASLSDIAPLSGLSNLENLSLVGVQISDIAPLSSLARLQSLYLFDVSISDISPLCGLTNLRELYLEGASVSDVLPLSGLTKLQSLYLKEVEAADFSPLSGLLKLRYLDLGGAPVSNVSWISALSKLQYLDLRGAPVTDVSELSNLVSLRNLYLTRTRISNVSPLSSLLRLRYLDLGGTLVRDISPLSGLISLEYLNVEETLVADFSPLFDMVNLRLLRLNRAAVSESLANTLQQSLPLLRIEYR